MSTPSGERPPLRIGTAERQAAYAALSAHLDAGRLDPDEYGERYGQASVARTRPELEALFADLPAPHPVFAPTATAPTTAPAGASGPSWLNGRPPARRPMRVWRLVPAVFLLLPIVTIAVAASTGFWFLFFVFPLAATILGRGFGRRSYRRRGYARGGYS